MVTSEANERPFCQRIHTETTRLESAGEIDVDTAAMRPELTAADLAPPRAAGVPDSAIVEALHVNVIFNLVNRLANAFEWSWDSENHVHVAAKAIKRFRYQLPGIVMR
ncbi:hypothetical protein [Actinokineospora sp.]|uniref:hypothetical protein n=1 Tax=Actinokineospora sp. TaxID=1872133 RepID=UPI003D6BBFF9